MHQEARELPVCQHNELISQHNELISQQFAIACHLPLHHSHRLCHRPPDDRPDRRRSLTGRLKPNIEQYLPEEPLSNTSYKSAISSIHQDAVRTATESSSSQLPLKAAHQNSQSPQDNQHLFDFPSKPITLTVESLWTGPNETAKHPNLAIDETSEQQQLLLSIILPAKYNI